MKNMIAVIISLLFVGCTTSPGQKQSISNPNIEDDYKIKSSGFIGCFYESITVENIVYSGASDTVSWKAICKDQLFYCSGIINKDGTVTNSTQISCTKGL
ncbi:hypothetical protein SAMN02745866_03548 [Alteromonadaceae bacterium Bs31]|nr:hypothetical protein SAMN02745866_03548 [Alteromonadaceae bacterium Bs31]